ncbi:MAG: hypothetical protein KGZ88_12000 [Methylomicrobium sp.]|nr:hypothetical protein [Methylomicrobium sp.]
MTTDKETTAAQDADQAARNDALNRMIKGHKATVEQLNEAVFQARFNMALAMLATLAALIWGVMR